MGRESTGGAGEWEGAGATMNHSHADRKMEQYLQQGYKGMEKKMERNDKGRE